MITMNVNVIIESIKLNSYIKVFMYNESMYWWISLTLNSYIKVSRIMSLCISGLVLHLIHI